MKPGSDNRIYSDSEAVALIRLRYWQHLLNERLKAKEFKIPVHLAFGHEAAAVAMDLTMRSDDALCLTHRNGAYNLARSKAFEVELAHYRLEPHPEIGGQMASMNLAMENTNIAYSSSIIGNNLAVASGIALHRKLVKSPGVVFVMTGDGAIEEGVVWESLIFARSHELRLVVVVENNNMSLGSSIEERRCAIDLSRVCSGLDVAYQCVSGALLSEIKAALGTAREQASNGRLSLVELDIKTFNQHAGPTPGWPEDPLRIALEEGLVFNNDPKDPLYHLQEAIGVAAFDRLAEQIMGGRHDE